MVEPTAAFALLPRGLVDQTQGRDEVIRPLVLFADRTARQRAQETHTHPDTVRTLRRRFRQQGMLGLRPADVEVIPRKRPNPFPEAVRQEVDRLKTLYDSANPSGCSSAVEATKRVEMPPEWCSVSRYVVRT
jgi:hypothetical protein